MIGITPREHDPIKLNQDHGLAFCLSTTFFRKPVHTRVNPGAGLFGIMLMAGQDFDLGVDAGNDLEDALIRLVVITGNGPILALRQDHAREGAG